MSYPDDFKDKKDDEGSQTSGGAGTSGKVEVRIATWAGDSRNEPRTPAERRHFKAMHEQTQARRVQLAKAEKKALENKRKVGPASLTERQAYTAGGGSGGGRSPFKKHRISEAAYFSGEESPLPSDNEIGEINEQDQKELVDRLQNQLRKQFGKEYTPQPAFNPKPRGPL